MMSPEHDPEAWNAFMCGNAILFSEFAKLVVKEERLSALEFIDKARAGSWSQWRTTSYGNPSRNHMNSYGIVVTGAAFIAAIIWRTWRRGRGE